MSSDEPDGVGRDSFAAVPDSGETSALAQLMAVLTGRAEDYIGEGQDSKASNGAHEEEKHLLSLVHTYDQTRSEPSAHTPACSDLVDALWNRWEQQPDELTLAACIETATELVDLCPADHSYRPSCCSNLAMLLGLRFRQTGERATLDGAVRLLREALSLRPIGHPDRIECCMNLGVLLLAQYNHTETLALIDESIELQREGLSRRPADDPRRAVACANLADALGARYQQTKEIAFLNEGIHLSREALALPSSDRRGQAACCTSLAVMLAFRFQQTGDSALLDEALHLNRKALDLRPIGDPDRFTACTKLAVELQRGFVRTGDVAMLYEAINLQREALALQSDHAPSRATSLQTLATSLNSLCSQTGDRAMLKEAVQCCREALDLQPDGHSEHRRASIQLAYALAQLFSKGGGDKEVLDEATALLHWILVALCPPGHRDRLICLSLLGMIGIDDNEHGTTLDVLIECLTASAHDILLLQHAVGILRLLNQRCMRASQKQALLSWCSSASDLLFTSTELAADHSAQLQNALRGSGLGTDAYMLASRINSLPIGLQLLEHTRGVIWSQALHLRNPQLDGLPDELAEQLRSVVQGLSATTMESLDNARVDGSGSQFLPSRDMLYEQRSRLLKVLQDIRSGPGLHDFMRGLPWQKLLSAAARHPVVVLIADEREAHALIIDSPEHMLAMAFPGFNSNVLQTFTLSASMPSNRGAPMQGANTERIGIGISKRASPSLTILGKLWRSIVKPILNQLRIKRSEGAVKPRLHWCATGAFAFVPIHAAGVYDGSGRECCAEYVVSSYTPTLTALLQARQDVQVRAPSATQVLMITAQYPKDTSLPRLPGVAQESRVVCEAATAAGASFHETERGTAHSDVISALKSAHIVHLACHGVQHASEPHKSRFCLSSGDLTIEELMQVDLKDAFCAFLSACETAKGDRQYADEVVHLAASMLFAGFKSVVATLWTMHDEDGPFIAKHFYAKLFEFDSIDIDAVPRALDHAVGALRDKGASPERWATFVHMGA